MKTISSIALLSGILLAAGSASAATLSNLQGSWTTPGTNIIKVHGVHPSCLYGSTKPPYKGGDMRWHKTPEYGVHISCPPKPPKGPGKLKLKRHDDAGNGLKLRQRQ